MRLYFQDTLLSKPKCINKNFKFKKKKCWTNFSANKRKPCFFGVNTFSNEQTIFIVFKNSKCNIFFHVLLLLACVFCFVLYQQQLIQWRLFLNNCLFVEFYFTQRNKTSICLAGKRRLEEISIFIVCLKKPQQINFSQTFFFG